MCLAVPGQIQSVIGDDLLTRIGKVAFAGVIKDASLAFVPEAAVGNYVLVHAGVAIAILDEHEAARTLDYLETLTEYVKVAEPLP